MTATITPLRPTPATPADLARDAHEQAIAYTREAEDATHEAGQAYLAHLLALADLTTANAARRDLYSRQAGDLEAALRNVASLRIEEPLAMIFRIARETMAFVSVVSAVAVFIGWIVR